MLKWMAKIKKFIPLKAHYNYFKFQLFNLFELVNLLITELRILEIIFLFLSFITESIAQHTGAHQILNTLHSVTDSLDQVKKVDTERIVDKKGVSGS